MKENLELLNECGPKTAGGAAKALGMYGVSGATSSALTSGCADAQMKTIEAAKERLFR